MLEFSELDMYETYYDNWQPYFAQENFQLHYIDTGGNVKKLKTKVFIKDKKIRKI